MPELSVIMPFCQEWPQVIWTVRSVAEELKGRVDFELIAIDNWCAEVQKQGRVKDKGGEYLKNVAGRGNPWLKVLQYSEKLSHWNAKRVGVEASSGKFLWFVDAHCAVGRDALYKMFEYYKVHHGFLDGTIHLPLTYQLLEWRKLIYKLSNIEPKKGSLHYQFSQYRQNDEPYEVPCMSTCGMLMTRELYDELGGWPKELGVYGGGENFMNFCLAVLGKKKWIMPGDPLYHHGDKRGYSYNYDDFVRNRMIASYLFGGKGWALRQSQNMRGGPRILQEIYKGVVESCYVQRQGIKEKQKITIEEWIGQWTKEG